MKLASIPLKTRKFWLNREVLRTLHPPEPYPDRHYHPRSLSQAWPLSRAVAALTLAAAAHIFNPSVVNVPVLGGVGSFLASK
jgi:hypothetical protein